MPAGFLADVCSKERFMEDIDITLPLLNLHIVVMWLETQYATSIYDPATDNITINKGTLVPNFPWWIPALAAVDVVTLLACCSWGAKLKRIKKEAERKKNAVKTRR